MTAEEIFQVADGRTIGLRASDNIAYGDVASVIARLQQAGVKTQIALVGGDRRAR